MWSEQEKYKNHFLQIQLRHLKPQQINNMVQNEIIRKKTNNTMYQNKGICGSALYFEYRAELAYGFETLPKLMKQLGSDDYLTQWKAINSLSELIVNPLHAQRAINRYAIVRRCQNVFLRIRLKYRKIKYQETARLLNIFYYIAMYRNGAKKILEKYCLLDQFYMIICDREELLEAVSKILPLLSQDIENRYQLIDDYKVYDKLTTIWNKDPCISCYPANLWLHLSHILEEEPREAVNRGFFEIFYKRIQGRLLRYHLWDMKCFELLLRCPQGQERFLQIDGIKMLYVILSEEQVDNYKNVIFALMNGLVTKRILWRCREFTNLPLIVTKLAKESEKSMQQLFCLQTLRLLGVMPVIKRFIKANCLDDIKNLECHTVTNEKERTEIIYWLEREIYHTSDLKKELIKIKEI